MLPENIIYLGVLINLLFSILYIKSIIYGKTRPNLISWFVWMLAPFVGTFLALKAGAGFSVLGIFMAGFGPFLVVMVSLFKKNAFWKIERYDLICGFFSLLALLLYIATNNLWISILFAIISDGLAAVPTIIKSWKFPETESSSVYLGGIINNIVSLLIIKNWIFSIYSFNIYFIVINIIIIFAIFYKKILRN
ncbi:MAG: hypothetical protein UR25_C0001G0109 [Candidatus Nomurabacteria bacterium GW2011_GWE1_32_28]|uniref:Uncharacterized protein n=1 Tax=Candidatus Nomurabacteria bacterium GW2011_GWF1_31_48 TaxID=1618767 RepID=A0A0F9YH06_9BACT|nr:MAG: hypothetical protein UR10_C0001G0062 [Candidatus Nomurabacteria bacterium GW2011_GWF2_30_133]KKP28940.1 MAG: hypothetical protein UR18_C0001G0061 [Candidatus Nomurabacteria bacterium GW2011_GWE2_31_40]KKP30678.1 MAG: hypothetical protein UR19_C0001G0062 [Candidatus Nomurabacteria bacterium GW2011_GWF1_31_48]KKP35196.1 MAG: hypothetical protein UR25_C0001G0109 [Candidatus Nomurabacteria bacterium GW2011_GWE1_32_28]HAS80506.1 hypothetical protein [Candidatus Nomurabacteria bacterium]